MINCVVALSMVGFCVQDRLAGYKLRYYFCRDLLESPISNDWVREHLIVLRLLKEVKQRIGIGYELYPFSFNEEKLIYKEHFVRRARTLNRIHNVTVARALKSRRGNVHLHGVIALVKNGEIVWYTAGWYHDHDFWRERASRVAHEEGLKFVGLHIGFLKTILDDPDYLVKIIGHVENILRPEEKKPRPGHESLVFNIVEKLYAEDRKAAILVEMPLGLKLLNILVDHSRDSSNYYDLALRNLELAAFPLRADIVVIRKPRGIAPGVYACARAPDQAFRLQRLFRARFPSANVGILSVEELMGMSIGGEEAEIIEVKTGAINEQAIGQVLVYEILLKMDINVESVRKTIAAPKERIDELNPLLRKVIGVLGISLKTL